MNNCCSHIDDFLDGDLSEEERAEWLALAHDCACCQEILEQHRQVDSLLSTAWSLVEGPALRSHNAECPLGQWRLIRVAGIAVAVAACVAIADFVAYRPPAPQQRSSSANAQDSVVPAAPESVDAASPEVQQNAPLTEPTTVVTSSTGLVVPLANEPGFTIVRYVSPHLPGGDLRADEASDFDKGEIQ
ncbi:hypothetical protein [Aeoliella sp.]|uniref:hypothetical protein n=1 Tax=Aeoliella sp. TaxID=2795800 RepID=UPI003CCB8DB6